MLPVVSPPSRLYPRDGLENLLAPAISYSFDQFRMSVQYLLSIALFLGGHHSAIESSHLGMPHAFKVWPDLSGRGLGLQWIQTRCFLFHAVEPFLASRLPRCLHGIAPFPKSIGLAPEMALRCRTRRH